jgi:hypothetical protein
MNAESDPGFCAAQKVAQVDSVYHLSWEVIENLRKRRAHNEAMRKQRGIIVSGGRLPGGGSSAGYRKMYCADYASTLGDSWDWWTPTRWEPTGLHPYDVRGVPAAGLVGTMPQDEDYWDEVAYHTDRAWKHSGRWTTCPECRRQEADKLVAGGLSFTRRREMANRKVTDRLTRDQIVTARARRLRKTKWPLDKGPWLTSREATTMAHVASQRALCGQYVAVLERCIPAPGLRVERLATPMMCGTRACGVCFDQKRAHAGYRMEGPWKQFVTFTLPQDVVSRYHAWRHCITWMSKLLKWIAREVCKGTCECRAVNCQSRGQHPIVSVNGGKFDYAWVVEPHKTDWPHFHVAWTAEYVCYDWLRETWAEITGLGLAHIHSKEMYSEDGICRYLTKYMTKSMYSDEILAILYRRRMWASTIRRKPKWEKGYRLVDILHGKSAQDAVDCATLPKSESSALAGVHSKYWEFVQGAPGKFSRWLLGESCSDAAIAARMETHQVREARRLKEIWELAKLRYHQDRHCGFVPVWHEWCGSLGHCGELRGWSAESMSAVSSE